MLGLSPPESANATSRPSPSASPFPSSPPSVDARFLAVRSAQGKISLPAATSATVLSSTPVRKGYSSSAVLSASCRCMSTSSIWWIGGGCTPPSAPYPFATSPPERRALLLEGVGAGEVSWLSLTLRRLLLPFVVVSSSVAPAAPAISAVGSDMLTSIIATALSASSPRSARVAAESFSSSRRLPPFFFAPLPPLAARARFLPPLPLDVVVISLTSTLVFVASADSNLEKSTEQAEACTSARPSRVGNEASAVAKKPPDPSAYSISTGPLACGAAGDRGLAGAFPAADLLSEIRTMNAGARAGGTDSTTEVQARNTPSRAAAALLPSSSAAPAPSSAANLSAGREDRCVGGITSKRTTSNRSMSPSTLRDVDGWEVEGAPEPRAERLKPGSAVASLLPPAADGTSRDPRHRRPGSIPSIDALAVDPPRNSDASKPARAATADIIGGIFVEVLFGASATTEHLAPAALADLNTPHAATASPGHSPTLSPPPALL